jgi:hypothetical protein
VHIGWIKLGRLALRSRILRRSLLTSPSRNDDDCEKGFGEDQASTTDSTSAVVRKEENVSQAQSSYGSCEI